MNAADNRRTELRALFKPTITPAHAKALEACGRNDPDEAVRLLETVQPGAPSYLLARGLIADIHLRRGRWSAAEQIATEVYEHARALGTLQPPDYISIVRVLAESISVQGRDVEAASIFAAAADLATEAANNVRDAHHELASEYELELAGVLTSWGTAATHMRDHETACALLRDGRAIFERYRAQRPKEHAELLAAYAEALRLADREYDAEQALREALSLAEPNGDEHLAVRIIGLLGRMGSDLFDWERDYVRLARYAESAASSGRHSAAHVRWCICSEISTRMGRYQAAVDAIAAAQAIEPHLDPRDLNRAKLRTSHARLLQRMGAPAGDIVHKLLEGARFWFEQLNHDLESNDFGAMASEMHENFRLLSRALLDQGAAKESVLAFEAGRALAHSIEVDPAFRERVLERTPFRGEAIDLAVLEETQQSLQEDDAVLIVTALPPDFVAFVVTKDDVRFCTSSIPDSPEGRHTLATDIAAVPTRLRERVGARSIPDTFHELARGIIATVGSRKVVAVIPYSTLHTVPWRALLRNAGLPWSQLPARTEFGLLLRATRKGRPHSRAVIALGHGGEGDVDFADEARAFARQFPTDAQVIAPCRAIDLVRALDSDVTVLVSCHGEAAHAAETNNLEEGELILELADGAVRAAEFIPERVRASLVILSACQSGVYVMTHGDFPVGAAPALIRAGARECLATRFEVRAEFAGKFFPAVGRHLAAGASTAAALALASAEHQATHDLWRDLACVELVGNAE